MGGWPTVILILMTEAQGVVTKSYDQPAARFSEMCRRLIDFKFGIEMLFKCLGLMHKHLTVAP